MLNSVRFLHFYYFENVLDWLFVACNFVISFVLGNFENIGLLALSCELSVKVVPHLRNHAHFLLSQFIVEFLL